MRKLVSTLIILCCFVINGLAFQNKITVTKVGTLPKYRPIARQARVSGDVVLELNIAPDGSVQSVQIQKNNAILSQGVKESIKNWKFACANCKQSNSFNYVFTFKFKIDYCLSDDIEHYDMQLPDQVVIRILPVKNTCNDCDYEANDLEQQKEWNKLCKESRSRKITR